VLLAQWRLLLLGVPRPRLYRVSRLKLELVNFDALKVSNLP